MFISSLHLLGRLVPLIMLIGGLFLLKDKEVLFNYFIWGYFFNFLLNLLLKAIFREPRPIHNADVLKAMSDYNILHHRTVYFIPFQTYGMPSGHSQTAFFCTCFLTLALHNNKVTLFFAFLTLVTMIQRVQGYFHTCWQVFVGSVVGALFGVLMYYMASQRLMGKLLAKPDDYAFFS